MRAHVKTNAEQILVAGFKKWQEFTLPYGGWGQIASACGDVNGTSSFTFRCHMGFNDGIITVSKHISALVKYMLNGKTERIT